MNEIIIIDSDNVRGTALAKRCFVRASSSVFVYTFENVWKLVCLKPNGSGGTGAEPNPDNWFVALRHYGQKNITKFPVVQGGVEMWYGGSGVKPDEKKTFNIQRPFSSDEINRVLDEDFEELLDWAFAVDRESRPLPRLLAPDLAREHSTALLILSQGFLAAHSDQLDEQIGDLMGWNDGIAKADGGLSDKMKEAVQNRDWWLKALGLPANREDEKWTEFEQRLRNELGPKENEWEGSGTKMLTDALRGGTSNPNFELVKNGYLDLARRFRPRGQQ